MTLGVLALDALDERIINEYGFDGFKLNTYGGIQTFAEMHETPFTLEVWPTVATGLPPEQHGITGSGTSEWDNPFVELASRFTGHLPETTRTELGEWAQKLTGAEWGFGVTDKPTIFDGQSRAVHNWPGVANPEALRSIWDCIQQANDNEISKERFEANVLCTAAGQLGWLTEAFNHDYSVAGVHVHAADAFGHPYASDEESLIAMYDRLEEFVTDLEASLGPDDELLLLSDHGIQVEWFGDESPSKHSWRAFVSSTLDTAPRDVYDVYDWINSHATESTTDQSDIEMPTDVLQDLGYVE